MKYTIIIALLFIFILPARSQDKLIIDKVVCKVGTETILLSDIESQFAYARDKTGGLNPDLKCEIFQSIIGQKLIVHQARLDSIEVSEDELEANLDFRIEGVLRQMNGDEAFFEEYYGMTINEMRDNLREDLEGQMLAERMQNQVMTEVDITPKEVKEFFSGIPVDSIPYLNAEVEISEIVVKPEVNKEERTRALKKILDLRKKILEGEDFAELAKKFSDDPGSGNRGGDLGFAERGTFVQEFEATAYALDLNELSEPVETEFGFHIMAVSERRGNKLRVKHILIKPEITEADRDSARIKLDSIKVDLENNKISFSQAVKKYSLEDVPSYHNNGSVQNPNTGKTIFETAELPTEIYFAIEDMDIGDISQPLEYPLPTGETYYRIVKLISKTRPHRASLDLDYTKIQKFAKESKKAEYFGKWIEEKLKDTYIEFDKDYINCPDVEEFINN
ncbi:MAG: peptidylprolyl isomerase [Saprospiraceae bacterium]|nr:peptidylprolyl isomerase [Bacteroidia bacterium]NNF21056.1 peptidylprolyl isomerase [Saprospiraceae bacterium]NNK89123.1 peptidylprolyl isomerase [Saprospiraceae bacterium]